VPCHMCVTIVEAAVQQELNTLSILKYLSYFYINFDHLSY
jgi:hypothetical protein